jgi:hypothetical protein
VRGRVPGHPCSGMRLLVALAAALALAGAVGAATDPRVAAVRWPGDTEGGAELAVDGDTAWILSGGYRPTNVFRVDGLVSRPVSVPRMFHLFAGDGQLWGTQLLDGGDDRLVFVDVRHGNRLRPKTAPRAGCAAPHRKSVVYHGRLWLDCGSRYVVYAPGRAAPVKELRQLGTLVEGGGGLWLHTIRDALACVEGPCRGAPIAVGPAESWAPAGDTAWALHFGSGDEAFATVVGFRARGVVDFTLPLPAALREPSQARVVGDELWLQSGPLRRLAVARYSLNAPELPPRLLRLPGVSRAAELAAPVEVGRRYAWVSVKDGSAFKVFRVDVPRDPPALRRIRAAVLSASVRTPSKLAIARGAGPPIHASCVGRGVYLRAHAYFCTIRFREGAEYTCVALALGRLAVDRRRGDRSACR